MYLATAPSLSLLFFSLIKQYKKNTYLSFSILQIIYNAHQSPEP